MTKSLSCTEEEFTKIYLAVMDKIGDVKEDYQYDTRTGFITRNEDYQGMNLLFSINMDKTKADPIAA